MQQSTDGASSGIKAVERAFDIVETLLDMNGATPVELAEEMDMPVSTTYDHLQTLVNFEYLLNEDGQYRVGSKVLYLGNKMRLQHEICRSAGVELVRVARETGHHAVLGIAENEYAVNYDLAQSHSSFRLFGGLGTRTLLHQSATGKALLAYEDREDRQTFIEGTGLPELTPNTITDESDLLAELDRIREQGYALDRAEAIEGTNGVAVPILDLTGQAVLGSVGVYAPADHRIEEFLETVQSPLERAAHSIELDLAYND